MSWLLDTDVVSELRKVGSGRSERRILGGDAGHGEPLALGLVAQEIEIGVLLRERANPAQGAHRRAWL